MTDFAAIYTKGDNFCDFLFAFKGEKTILKWVFLEEKILFLLSVDSIEKGEKPKISRITAPVLPSRNFT